MQTKDLVSTLKRFDAYPKTLEDFRIKTFGGGAGKLKDCVWNVNFRFNHSYNFCVITQKMRSIKS